MTLKLTWTKSDIDSVICVLKGDNHNITDETKSLTQTFINVVKAGGEIRHEYNRVTSVLLSFPDQILYFVREHVKARIIISYENVPEFKHVVNFYMDLVRAARTSM